MEDVEGEMRGRERWRGCESGRMREGEGGGREREGVREREGGGRDREREG